MTTARAAARPPVPVVDARAGGALAAVEALPRQVELLLAAARRRYTRPGLALGDVLSRRWLRRNANPYLPEIAAVARRLGAAGAYALNLSYEWACTTGLVAGGPLLRVLDWQLDGLGRGLAVLRRRGPAGEWLDLGWPGFVGCVTGLAPGRFAAAINQPPLPGTGLGPVADWIAARPAFWRSRALPPAHLLRRAFDEAPDYAAALALLRDTPVCAAAFFVLAGAAGEGCVIERTPGAAAVRLAAPVAAATNHWVTMPRRGAPRGRGSDARLRAVEALLRADADPWSLAWVAPPILNADTRLVAVADPATGRLALQGFERDGPATRPLRLDP